MMQLEKFWEVAVGIAGIGAISSFVLWSLYKHWLTVPALSRLTKDQIFKLFRLFLVLTFLFAIFGLIIFAYTNNNIEKESLAYQTIAADIGSESDEVIANIAGVIESSNPSEVYYVMFDISSHPVSLASVGCEKEKLIDCEILDFYFQKCDYTDNAEDWIRKAEGRPPLFEKPYTEMVQEAFDEGVLSISPGCRPLLRIPTKMPGGKSNVKYCHPSGYIISGFFSIEYIGGAMGTSVYFANEAIVSPDRAQKTLEMLGQKSRCWS